MMNVRDLIGLLGSYPEDMRVVVDGYEQGYDDLSPRQISVVPIALNTGVHEWDGRHGDEGDAPAHASEWAERHRDAVGLPAARRESAPTIKALVLRRTSR